MSLSYIHFADSSGCSPERALANSQTSLCSNCCQDKRKSVCPHGLSPSDSLIRQKVQAFPATKLAAETGDAKALFELGCCYQNGLGAPKNAENDIAGFQCFEKAALLGNADAQSALGDCYRKGVGVPQDSTQAIKFYRQAASQSHPDGLYFLACCHFLGGHGCQKDERLAVSFYKKAAGRGHTDANFELGSCYYNGVGVSKDYVAAKKHFQIASEKGCSEAQCELGVCYAMGQGTDKDQQAGLRWFMMSAQQGSLQGQAHLATWYRAGIPGVVLQDEVKAFKFDQIAAAGGLAQSMANLGVAYLRGQGTEQNEKLAVQQFKKALEIDPDCIRAEFGLGSCYYDGLGVSKDEKKAFRYKFYPILLSENDFFVTTKIRRFSKFSL